MTTFLQNSAMRPRLVKPGPRLLQGVPWPPDGPVHGTGLLRQSQARGLPGRDQEPGTERLRIQYGRLRLIHPYTVTEFRF